MPDNTLAGEFELDPNNSSDTNIESTNADTDSGASTDKIIKPAVRSTPHFFSSFSYYPKHVKLNDQEKEEEIVLIIRRRFITNTLWIAAAVFLAVIFPILAPFILAFSPFPPPNTIQNIIIVAFYYLIIFGFVLLRFTLWYFHVGIITNKRIKDIDIHGVLYRDVSETRLNLVQDVNFVQHGFIPSLFNYGDVFVQTAGTEPNIEFDKAPRPAQIARIIGDMLKKH